MHTKKLLLFILALALLSTTALATDTPTPVTFADPTVEMLLREQLKIPDGTPVTDADLYTVTQFVYSPHLRWHDENPGQTLKLNTFDYDAYPEINTLEDFAHCRSLESIYLDFQPISDLSPLADIPGLSSISIGHASDDIDFTPLSGKKSIRDFALYFVNADDYEPIFSLPNLQSFRGVGLPSGIDLSPLAGKSNLKSFDLTSYYGSAFTTDYSPLASHTGIEKLELSGIDEPQLLTLVESFPALTWLHLEDPDITNDTLAELSSTPLSFLRIDNCPGITNLSGLSTQAYLTSLQVFDCPLTDITALAEMPAPLETLWLTNYSGWSLDFSPLSSLEHLTDLYVTTHGTSYVPIEIRQLVPDATVRVNSMTPEYEPLSVERARYGK